MRWITLLLVLALGACGGSGDPPPDGGGDGAGDGGGDGGDGGGNDDPPPIMSIALNATADATLYSEDNAANGAGDFLFVGRTAEGFFRRTVIRFDLSAIPAGATIVEATLVMNSSRTQTLGANVTVHRLMADWTEGVVDAPGQEGAGEVNGPTDARWTFPWTVAGGDFVAAPSSSTAVSIGTATFEGLAADVQAWIDGTATNFGWILQTIESGEANAKRLDSRENFRLANRPVLNISYR